MKPIANIPRNDAIKMICKSMRYKRQTEHVPLEEAIDRVVSTDICSALNVPNTKCSQWDGISFSYAHYMACGGNVADWKEGEDFLFTNTGIAVFRDDFDTMVMRERIEWDGRRMKKIDDPTLVQGQNMILPGAKIHKGELLLNAGTKVRPSHLNLMASGGVTFVPVLKKPVVAIVPSGNELVPYLATPLPGQTTESNSLSMMAKVRMWGGEPRRYPICGDDREEISKVLKEAAAVADLIVIGGGSGMGEYDFLQESAASAGELYFSSVEHGPAKRTSFFSIHGTPAIGLVGPPGGEELSFDFYVRPALCSCLGQEAVTTTVEAVLDTDIPVHHRTDFMYTVKVNRAADGTLHATCLPHADIDRNIAFHNAYIFVRKASSGLKAGQTVTLEMRTGYENV